MKYIFLDTETARLFDEIRPDEDIDDIVLQLSYIVLDDEVGFDKPIMIRDVKTNPGCSISFGTMSVHHITPESVEGLPPVRETKEYSDLKSLVDSGQYTFVAHNADFDIRVLGMVGIDVRAKCPVIDTLRVAEFVNDQSRLSAQMNKLRYLTYFYGLYRMKGDLFQKYGLQNDGNYHEAISDIVDLILIFLHYNKVMKMPVDAMIKLSNEPFLLTFIPYGSQRGQRFSETRPSQLTWLASSDNPNVAYTAKYYGG